MTVKEVMEEYRAVVEYGEPGGVYKFVENFASLAVHLEARVKMLEADTMRLVQENLELAAGPEIPRTETEARKVLTLRVHAAEAKVQELEADRDEWKALYETKDGLYQGRVTAHDEALVRIVELKREVAEFKKALDEARRQSRPDYGRPVARCGVVGEPPLGTQKQYTCELPEGHGGQHRSGGIQWLGYHPNDPTKTGKRA